jgi:hypothetical protein
MAQWPKALEELDFFLRAASVLGLQYKIPQF